MINKNIVITSYQNKILCLYFEDGRIEKIEAFSDSNDILGNIYRGKVSSVSKNINSCFVDIAPGQTVFVSCGKNEMPKVGEELTVQIVKEAVKTKAPVASMELSIEGRYCVVDTKKGKPVSYSRKLSRHTRMEIERALVGELDDSLRVSVIVRTECEGLNNFSPVIEEIKRLQQMLLKILDTQNSRTCYSLLYQEKEGFIRFIQEVSSYDKITTDLPEIYEKLIGQDGIETQRVSLYQDEYNLTKLYGIESKVNELLQKKVWLPSGGSIFIEPTEALVSIDINTGKCVLKKDKETLISLINKEAVDEICRQLKLRNLSGIIIIDFINMESKEAEDELLCYLKNKIAYDKVKTSFADMTYLGLVELTRMKVRKSLFEQLYHD